MLLYRSLDGITIHSESCKRRGQAIHWRWAEGLTSQDVARQVAKAPWLKPCRVCKPLDKEATK